MKHVCIVSLSETFRDPRVSKQARWLKEQFSVTTVGLGKGLGLDGVSHVSIVEGAWGLSEKALAALLLFAGLTNRALLSLPGARSLRKNLEQVVADVWVANDIETLPFCLEAAQKNGARVWFDAHEFYPAEFDSSLKWRLIFGRFKADLCRRFIPRAAGFSTVSDGVAGAYRDFMDLDPIVITNAPEYAEIQVRELSSGGPIRLVHHGAALRNRRLEHIIGVLEDLDPTLYSLDLFLVPSDPGYYEELRLMSKRFPNLKFNAPVKMLELSQRLNEFDVGIYSLPPDNMNDRFALPNKFFEFIQARLCLAIGPSPDMQAIVKRYNLGVVAEDFSGSALAQSILSLSRESIMIHKRASSKVAKELSAEPNRRLFLEKIRSLLS